MDDTKWMLFSVLAAIAAYIFGKYSKDKETQVKKHEFAEEEMADLKIFNDEPVDVAALRSQMDREKETNKKMIEEMEQEINYLKSELVNAKKNYDSRIVKFT